MLVGCGGSTIATVLDDVVEGADPAGRRSESALCGDGARVQQRREGCRVRRSTSSMVCLSLTLSSCLVFMS